MRKGALLLVAGVAAASCTGSRGAEGARGQDDQPYGGTGCSVTLGDGNTPPGEAPNPDYYGNGSLWTSLWPEGRIVATEDDVLPDGSIAMKFPWWRGVKGELTISGRRLDGPAPPLRAEIPRGYGKTGFQASGIIFATPGCWEVTGRAGDSKLTFVTLVVGAEEGTTASGAPRGPRADVQEVRITRDTARGPEACHPSEVGNLVVGFFAAVNQGQAHRVTDLFTPELGWYSVTEWSPRTGKRHFVAYEPSKLRRYFEKRVTQQERLHLLELDVDYERARNVGHVAYVLTRTGDDLKPFSDTAIGKGAIDCGTGRIAIWSMGQDKRSAQESSRICPGDPEPLRVAIASARA